MVKLIFYGGVNEIGGDKIQLEDKGAKIFLDFGQSFTFEPQLSLISSNSLRNLRRVS